jgi:hypothetical protein
MDTKQKVLPQLLDAFPQQDGVNVKQEGSEVERNIIQDIEDL